MIRMVRVLRAKSVPQSSSRLSHTHAPEPARSRKIFHNRRTATMGRHAWLAAKRTPSIKPMMSSASVGIASANAGCPDRLCNNLRPAHRHLEHDTIVTVKKK